MIKIIEKINHRYYLGIAAVLLGIYISVAVAKAGESTRKVGNVEFGAEKKQKLKSFVYWDVVHEQRIRFASEHGVADPVALAAAVKHSPMASLLISVAIEESLGDPVALGSDGEEGAWQVKPTYWGSVSKNIHRQANQAERIISDLLLNSKGNKKKALARYNGGTSPPVKSFRYAERILKRAKHLQIAEKRLQPDYTILSQAIFDSPGNSWML